MILNILSDLLVVLFLFVFFDFNERRKDVFFKEVDWIKKNKILFFLKFICLKIYLGKKEGGVLLRFFSYQKIF